MVSVPAAVSAWPIKLDLEDAQVILGQRSIEVRGYLTFLAFSQNEQVLYLVGHLRYVNGRLVTDGGKQFLVACDLEKLTCKNVCELPFEPTLAVISHDQQHAVIGHKNHWQDESFQVVKLWTGEIERKLEGQPSAIYLSRAGNLIVGYRNGKVAGWKGLTGEPVFQTQVIQEPVLALTEAAADETFVAAGSSGTAAMVSADQVRVLSEKQSFTAPPVWCGADLLARYDGQRDDVTFQTLPVNAGQKPGAPFLLTDIVGERSYSHLKIAARAPVLVAEYWDKPTRLASIDVVDLQKRQVRQRLPLESSVSKLMLSPTGQYLALASQHDAFDVIRLADAHYVVNSTPKPVTSVGFLSQGRAISLRENDTQFQVWNLTDGSRLAGYHGLLSESNQENTEPILSATVQTGDTVNLVGRYGVQRIAVDARTNRELINWNPYSRDPAPLQDLPRGAFVSRAGKFVLTYAGASFNWFRSTPESSPADAPFWQLGDTKDFYYSSYYRRNGKPADLSPDGTWCVTQDMVPKQSWTQLSLHHRNEAGQVVSHSWPRSQFSAHFRPFPLELRIYDQKEWSRIPLYDLPSLNGEELDRRTEREPLELPPDFDLTFSPDGELVAVRSDKLLQILDAETHEPLFKLAVNATAVAFAPDNCSILVGTQQGYTALLELTGPSLSRGDVFGSGSRVEGLWEILCGPNPHASLQAAADIVHEPEAQAFLLQKLNETLTEAELETLLIEAAFFLPGREKVQAITRLSWQGGESAQTIRRLSADWSPPKRHMAQGLATTIDMGRNRRRAIWALARIASPTTREMLQNLQRLPQPQSVQQLLNYLLVE